jgi:hypothetical protein
MMSDFVILYQKEETWGQHIQIPSLPPPLPPSLLHPKQILEWAQHDGKNKLCTARPGWQTMSLRVGKCKYFFIFYFICFFIYLLTYLFIYSLIHSSFIFTHFTQTKHKKQRPCVKASSTCTTFSPSVRVEPLIATSQLNPSSLYFIYLIIYFAIKIYTTHTPQQQNRQKDLP